MADATCSVVGEHWQQQQHPVKCVVLEEDGLRKGINGYTWAGIEYGEPPGCAYTFFEYVDALRLGHVESFKKIEKATVGWYFPTLDRGAGAALHFAAEQGELAACKFLIEQRGVPVNQRDKGRGWTSLMRVARQAHYKHAPFLELFEYLLQKGADPGIKSYPSKPMPEFEPYRVAAQVLSPPPHGPLSYLDVAVEKGFLWEEGEVRATLKRLADKYADVPKAPEFVYDGPVEGPLCLELRAAWDSLPKLYPPDDWRPPPPPGYVEAQGVRLHAQDPWRPAGDNDGSYRVRPMTREELKAQIEWEDVQ